MDLVEFESTSEIEDQKSWGSESQMTQVDISAHPASDCGIGHRVLASRSVLALAIDEQCVFAGLQGGDIVVCRELLECSQLPRF
jgi:di- and tripeptidase